MKKATIILLAVLLALPFVAASEESLALASLERVIVDKLDKNKDAISADFDGKVDRAEVQIKEHVDVYIAEKKDELDDFFWWDRMIRFAVTFLAVLLAGLMLLFWHSKHIMKLLEIQRLSKPANFEKQLVDVKKAVLVEIMGKSKVDSSYFKQPVRLIWEEEFKKICEANKK